MQLPPHQAELSLKHTRCLKAPKTTLRCDRAIQPLGLPKELQLSILEHLTFAELAAFGLVSKASYAVVEPVLYSELAFTWTWAEHNPPREANVPRLDLVLRSLLDRPQLATHANTLAIRGKPFNTQRSSLTEVPKLTIEALPMDKACPFIRRQ